MARYYRHRSWSSILFGRWAVASYPATIIGVGSLVIRRSLLRGADYLGGYPEIMHFLRVNGVCFTVCAATLLLEIVLCAFFCVNKDNSAQKLGAFIWGILVAAVCTVLLGVFTFNVYQDSRGTTTARPDTYVLCTYGSKHYIAFKDRQEYTLIPIKEDTYEKLQKGAETEEHKDIYDVVKNSGYRDVTEYTSAVKVEYYFNCAMIEKAELLY